MGVFSKVAKIYGAPASMFGSVYNDFTGVSSSAKAQYQNQMALDNANRSWQENLSNTAHQREVADLKAAGLNPILSALGSGASTPSGGVGSASTGVGNGFGETVVNSAKAKQMANLQERALNQQLLKNEADIENQTRESKAYEATQRAEEDYYRAMIASINAELPAVSSSAQLKALENDYDYILKKNVYLKDENYTKWRVGAMKAEPILGTVLPVVNTVNNTAHGLANISHLTRPPNSAKTIRRVEKYSGKGVFNGATHYYYND